MWMIFLLLLSLILEWHVGLIFRFRAFQKHLFYLYCKKRTKTNQQQKGKHTLITTNKYKQEKKWPI